MKARTIRPIAICVFRNRNRILAGVGFDSRKNQTFYRPLGGGIEFGESSRETIVRELGEEIGADVANLHYLGTIENIFTFEGETGHEIIQVYDGELVDKSLYKQDSIEGNESTPDGPLVFQAVWVSLDDIAGGSAPLYPDGLLAMLRERS